MFNIITWLKKVKVNKQTQKGKEFQVSFPVHSNQVTNLTVFLLYPSKVTLGI